MKDNRVMSKSQQVPQTEGAGDQRPQTLVFLTLFGDLGLTALLWEWGRSASTYKSSCKQIVYCTLTHTLQRKVTNKHNKMLTCISWALAFWEILYKPFSTFSGFLHDP